MKPSTTGKLILAMKEIIEVYHAGTETIPHPLCHIGRPNLDFGKGFYLTDIYDQALIWAKRKGRERKQNPRINIYTLSKIDLFKEGTYKIFENYDEEWLDFIVKCRTLKIENAPYDYIEGGVADDRVIDTINLYIQGILGKDQTLKELIFLSPNNQICITNQVLLEKHLHFIDCVTIPKDEIL